MSPEAVALVTASVIGAIVGAGATTAFNNHSKRIEEQRRDTGRRIGKVESWMDFQKGFQAGLRAAERKRQGHGQ